MGEGTKISGQLENVGPAALLPLNKGAGTKHNYIARGGHMIFWGAGFSMLCMLKAQYHMCEIEIVTHVARYVRSLGGNRGWVKTPSGQSDRADMSATGQSDGPKLRGQNTKIDIHVPHQ